MSVVLVELRRLIRTSLARWTLGLELLGAGAIYALAPWAVTSGNVAIVREMFPLTWWGVVWLLAGALVLGPGRLPVWGHSLAFVSYLLFAAGTAATFLTEQMDAPAGPLRVLALAAIHLALRFGVAERDRRAA